MFYLNSTLNLGIQPIRVFQLEVYNKVDRLLTGLTAQQNGTTARWYSNKTTLVLVFNDDISRNGYLVSISYSWVCIFKPWIIITFWNCQDEMLYNYASRILTMSKLTIIMDWSWYGIIFVIIISYHNHFYFEFNELAQNIQLIFKINYRIKDTSVQTIII